MLCPAISKQHQYGCSWYEPNITTAILALLEMRNGISEELAVGDGGQFNTLIAAGIDNKVRWKNCCSELPAVRPCHRPLKQHCNFVPVIRRVRQIKNRLQLGTLTRPQNIRNVLDSLLLPLVTGNLCKTLAAHIIGFQQGFHNLPSILDKLLGFCQSFNI